MRHSIRSSLDIMISQCFNRECQDCQDCTAVRWPFTDVSHALNCLLVRKRAFEPDVCFKHGTTHTTIKSDMFLAVGKEGGYNAVGNVPLIKHAESVAGSVVIEQ